MRKIFFSFLTVHIDQPRFRFFDLKIYLFLFLANRREKFKVYIFLLIIFNFRGELAGEAVQEVRDGEGGRTQVHLS